MAAHAKKSASGSKRWMNCVGSLSLVARMPKELQNPSSPEAQLGTAAHALGERCLKENHASSRVFKGWTIQVVEGGDEVWYAPGEAPTASGFFEVTDDMCTAVDLYIDVCTEIVRSLPGAEAWVERRFSLEWLRPDMFGTSDFTVFQFLGKLVVIDYKHGQGVPVEVADNSQELYYALGMAQDMDWCFEELELVIVQPRCPHKDGPVRRITLTVQDLRDFEAKLAQASDAVDEAELSLQAIETLGSNDPVDYLEWEGTYLWAGEEQCKFCPANGGYCRAALRRAEEEAAADFAAEPLPLDVPADDGSEEALQRIARIVEWAPFLDSFVKAAKNMAQRRLEQGLPMPRHKLVRGKANRVWSVPEEDIVAKAAELGIASKDLYTAPKLRSPAQVEKLGKEMKLFVAGKFDKKTETWTVPPAADKGQGKIVMAHESDHREAVEDFDPAKDFEGMDFGDNEEGYEA